MRVYTFFKRGIASFAVGALLLGLLPAQAFAADGDPAVIINSITEGQVLTESTATVSFTVSNVTVGADTDHVHYYLDSNSVVMVYSTDAITLSDLAEGSHTFKIVVADASHTEYTNTEASATVNFSVDLPDTTTDTAMPDLTVSDLSVDSNDTLSVVVTNSSTADVSVTTGSTYIYIDGDLWTYSWSTLSDQSFLTAGGSSTIQPEVLSAGTYTVKACVDVNDVVEESDENNNCLEESLTVEADVTDDSDDDSNDDDATDDSSDDDGVDDAVDWADVANDFASETGYEAPKVVVVKWGVLDPEVDQDEEDDGSSATEWDGSFSIADGILHLDRPILFENSQDDKVTDIVRNGGSKPVEIEFNSLIGPHYDGLMVRYRAADGEDPVFTFASLYEDISVSVAASTLEDGPYEYDAGDGYGVWIGLVEQSKIQHPFFPGGGLFEIRYGNLDGDASTDATTYSGTLALTGDGSLKVLKTYLFEDNGTDEVTTEEGTTVAWSSTISGHWDSVLVQFVPDGDTTDDVTTERGLTLTLGSYSGTFDDKEDFGVFDIGDGTGNQVEVRNFVGNAGEVHEQFVEAKLDLADSLADFAAAIESAEESGSYSDELLEELQEVYDHLSDYNFVPGTYGLAQRALVQLTNSINNGETEEELQGLLNHLKEQYEAAKENARKRKFALGILKFKDVDDDNDAWYYNFVDHLSGLGILSGYKDANGNALGEFRPSWNITYAEALKVVLLSTGTDVQSGDPTNYYADSHWAKDYVYTGEQLGLTILDDQYLDLNTQITRGEFVRLILEALSVDPGSYSSYQFPDISSDENAAYIQYAYEQGIVSGNPDGNFYPDRSINRAEVAKIMSKVIELYSLEAAIES